MGLFASRPQEPFEWAGLPSEPDNEHTEAELLETPPIDPFAITTSGGGAASISISVAAPPEPAPTVTDGAQTAVDDAADGAAGDTAPAR
ncbi:hypothetical protein [Microbacterium sp.]|uniref:hypothetical protein n=1 Tax=Microbacterium sp. TaxID=51671 RepID=UPI003A92C2F7